MTIAKRERWFGLSWVFIFLIRSYERSSRTGASLYYYLVVESTGAGDDKYAEIKSVKHTFFFFFWVVVVVVVCVYLLICAVAQTHTHTNIYIYIYIYRGAKFHFLSFQSSKFHFCKFNPLSFKFYQFNHLLVFC